MSRNVRLPALLAGIALCGAAPTAWAQDSVKVTQARAYEGQFRPIQQASGGMGMRGSQRIFGNVKIVFRESTDRSKVTLMINTSLNQTEILQWSVNPGRPESAWKVTGVTKRVAASVITTCTVAPSLTSRRTSSAAL